VEVVVGGDVVAVEASIPTASNAVGAESTLFFRQDSPTPGRTGNRLVGSGFIEVWVAFGVKYTTSDVYDARAEWISAKAWDLPVDTQGKRPWRGCGTQRRFFPSDSTYFTFHPPSREPSSVGFYHARPWLDFNLPQSGHVGPRRVADGPKRAGTVSENPRQRAANPSASSPTPTKKLPSTRQPPDGAPSTRSG